MAFDPIGPGTPAWEASDAAIEAGRNGEDPQPHIDEMTRHLIANGASAQENRQWESCVWEQIAEEGA